MESKFDEVKYVKMHPARAIAYSCIGVAPEDEAMGAVQKWVKENNLEGTMRLFGFNTYAPAESPAYGFGYCATIPEGIEIPEPFYEKRLPGGIYAVISEYEGDPSFGWKKIGDLMNDKNWEWEYDGDRGCVGLEEHIWGIDGFSSILVMLPVKKKQ